MKTKKMTRAQKEALGVKKPTTSKYETKVSKRRLQIR